MDGKYKLPPLKMVKLVVEAFTKFTVEEATKENGAPERASKVEVAAALCPYTVGWVKGSPAESPVIVIGELPSTLNVEQVTEPAQVAEVVETVPKLLAPVQYARLPMTGAEEVPMPR